MSKQSYVYFLKPIGIDGPIKIGCTRVPERRLMELSVWSPWPLEIIGAVKGTSRDELNFHNRFKDCHSHREWFHSTPLLRATIAAVLKTGDFSAILHMPINGCIRSINREPRTENMRRRLSYASKIMWTTRRLRKREGDGGVWCAPDDINRIMDDWRGDPYRHRPGKLPSTEEMTRVHEYLASPETHSVRCKYFRRSPTETAAEYPSN